ncbi:Arc-like DNA binding domain [Serratia ficaria]|uniref:Arc family DNA-binding protein n=1 Tax=Serratia ficaria TaxID=61651 RepID=UPI0021C4FC5F|nr:Arc family DNA-binding protein [Serratia ficaria]CAI2787772.1 Arc-like DNA binding domain [Serratia ficaria]
MSERRYKHPQVNLRLPEDMKEKIAKLAAHHGRSANAEMVAAIEFWVSANEKMLSEEIPGDRVVLDVRKDELPAIAEAIKKNVIAELAKHYELTPKKNKKPT